jgi:hypothetical protein
MPCWANSVKAARKIAARLWSGFPREPNLDLDAVAMVN